MPLPTGRWLAPTVWRGADGQYDSQMFGRSWDRATAKIVTKKFKEGGERSGVWEYVADITPATGAPFRTTLRQPHLMNHVVWLQEGEVVGALADVKRQRAKFDRSDPRVNGDKPTDKEAFQRALNQPPGTAPPNQ